MYNVVLVLSTHQSDFVIIMSETILKTHKEFTEFSRILFLIIPNIICWESICSCSQYTYTTYAKLQLKTRPSLVVQWLRRPDRLCASTTGNWGVTSVTWLGN